MVLHFYQPPVQDLGITKQVLQSCYLPLLKLIKNHPEVRLTINLNGGLLEQLAKMEQMEFFGLLKGLVENGQVELLNSPAYHPIMPLTPTGLWVRQLDKQRQVTKETVGIEIGKGLFPPELAIDEKLINWARGKFDYVLVDETAVKTYQPVVKYKSEKVVVNCRKIADTLRGFQGKLEVAHIKDITKAIYDNQIIVTVNDAEAFGHHYEERLELLGQMWQQKEWEFVSVKEVAEAGGEVIEQVKTSSWQVWLGDGQADPFKLWANADSPLQQQYGELLKIAAELVEKYKGQTSPAGVMAAKEYLDRGYSSCYLYWLSAWPWWHPDLVQKGADQLIRSVRTIEASKTEKRRAEELYHDFLKEMWLYHWSGEVQVKYREYDKLLGRVE